MIQGHAHAFAVRGDAEIMEFLAGPQLEGRPVAAVQTPGEFLVCLVTRAGASLVPRPDTVLQAGGKIGSFLAEDLAGKGHGVALVERRPEIVERLVRELPAGVLVIAAISSTTVIGRLIEEEFALGDILQLLSLAKGRLALVELDLPGAGCPSCGRRLADLKLPPETVLATVLRGSHVFVPHGNTRFDPGDRIIAITATGQREALRRAFLEH